MYGLSNSSVSSDIEWLLTCISRSWAIRPIDAVDVLCAQLLHARSVCNSEVLVRTSVVKWSSICCMFGMALTRPSLAMQLMSGVDVFAHVSGQKADTSSNFCDNIQPYDKRRFSFCHCDTIVIARQHTDARYWYSKSVRLSVCPSVRYVPVSDEKGLTYRQSFFTVR